MLTDTTAVRNYFSKLGFEQNIADIYLALHAHGPQSISELARTSKVERTRIYRLIDTLLEANLIEVETHASRGIMKAAPISNLHILITQREQELQSLQDELGLIEQVLARNSLSNPATRVQFYQSSEGLKQMLWNETRSKTDILSVCYQVMQPETKKAFWERWAEKVNTEGICIQEIHGDTFRKSEKEWYAHNDNVHLKHYEDRYIDPRTYLITHSWDVYDNVVSYYHWKDGEVFGIEIYNQEMADSQRQLFEMLWGKSQPEMRPRS